MVTGKFHEHRSDFTTIYGNYTPEFIEAFKDRIEETVSKISGCSVGRTTGFYNSYFWVEREDGSTGCIKMYGPGRQKGISWRGYRPKMLITTVKTGVSVYSDDEIHAGVIPSLTPQNPVWLEVEINDGTV